VLGRRALDGQAHAAGNLLERLLDARPLGEHGLAIRRGVRSSTSTGEFET